MCELDTSLTSEAGVGSEQPPDLASARAGAALPSFSSLDSGFFGSDSLAAPSAMPFNTSGAARAPPASFVAAPSSLWCGISFILLALSHLAQTVGASQRRPLSSRKRLTCSLLRRITI